MREMHSVPGGKTHSLKASCMFCILSFFSLFFPCFFVKQKIQFNTNRTNAKSTSRRIFCKFLYYVWTSWIWQTTFRPSNVLKMGFKMCRHRCVDDTFMHFCCALEMHMNAGAQITSENFTCQSCTTWLAVHWYRLHCDCPNQQYLAGFQCS